MRVGWLRFLALLTCLLSISVLSPGKAVATYYSGVGTIFLFPGDPPIPGAYQYEYTGAMLAEFGTRPSSGGGTGPDTNVFIQTIGLGSWIYYGHYEIPPSGNTRATFSSEGFNPETPPGGPEIPGGVHLGGELKLIDVFDYTPEYFSIVAQQTAQSVALDVSFNDYLGHARIQFSGEEIPEPGIPVLLGVLACGWVSLAIRRSRKE